MSASLRSTLMIALIATVALVAGCSKKQDTPLTPTDPFTQEEADDVMVLVAQTMATDNGGWLVECLSTVDGTAGLSFASFTGGQRLPTTARSRTRTPGSTRWHPMSTLRDTSFMRSQMTYSFSFNYVDTLGQDHFNFVPGGSIYMIEGLDGATGNVVNSTYNGWYHHNGDFQADYREDSPNVVFDGFNEDSTLGYAYSAFRADSSYWFLDNFFDYEAITVSRDRGLNPWPLSGIASLELDSYRLNSTNITDIANHVEAVATVGFNGTIFASVTIQDDFVPPSGVYMYTINLQTGELARVTTP